MASVEIAGVSKQYAGAWAVDRVSITVPDGSFFSLLGPSGSGKTTLLRLVAGFLRPDAGTVRIGPAIVNEVPPHKRDIGMVFQQYALFPHQTVLDNVAFGLEMRGMGRKAREAKAREALEMVRMAGRERAYPKELSGGQQQRIAIARSIAARPAVWLLDEPLSALDRKLRIEMQSELRSLQKLLGITTIYVTHDQEEALAMSDGIAIFRDGRIAQQGSAEDLYERPADGFVADFLGSANLIEGVVARGPQGLHVVAEGEAFRPSADHILRENERVHLAIRPERLDLSGAPGAAQGLPARVESVLYLGSDLRVVLRTRGGALLVARAPSRGTALAEGAEVFAAFKPEDAAIVAH
ncbi:ABC transporter ATP-binding protein [Xanthobacter tagetidis]|uniref:ABC transporter ATP-binding protein n=1 Tax=Xanthobacter tagetidis TaxID=60216 RepID=A0A3L7A2Y8_9HYPH|nr:ABC transporter ATP-binding protein [Xanthobacter tagetidis]MBB6309894.1 putative spermidine/putrescine transport system ATP-binding protein [Xanthobacter tagetidis]RLP74609.1 ABC transporter ATP-binding protein [Xanthobacter tagetidis]